MEQAAGRVQDLCFTCDCFDTACVPYAPLPSALHHKRQHMALLPPKTHPKPSSLEMARSASSRWMKLMKAKPRLSPAGGEEGCGS